MKVRLLLHSCRWVLNLKLKNTLRRCWTFSWFSVGFGRPTNVIISLKLAGKLFGGALIVLGLRVHETAESIRENDRKENKDKEWVVIHRNPF